MNIADAETLYVRPKTLQKHHNYLINSNNTFFSFFRELFFVLVTFFFDIGSKENTDFRKNAHLEFFRKIRLKWFSKFSISRLSSINKKKRQFYGCFHCIYCFAIATNVQRWMTVVQKCSSLNQLWLELSKLKSAGTALSTAENAKNSESSLKMT